jgi:hypothetical protein
LDAPGREPDQKGAVPGVFKYGLFPETDIAACDEYHFVGQRWDVGLRVERHRFGGPKHGDDTDLDVDNERE